MARLFDGENTLCIREGNKCKRRKKCNRYSRQDRDDKWDATYWFEQGELCEHFQVIPKTISQEKAQEHAREIEIEIRKGLKD